MKNKAVEKHLNNFSLINTQGMEAFVRERSKLLSPNLVAICNRTFMTSQPWVGSRRKQL